MAVLIEAAKIIGRSADADRAPTVRAPGILTKIAAFRLPALKVAYFPRPAWISSWGATKTHTPDARFKDYG